ncbi:hypothetical protein HZA97_01100 [Candidatus Woesearchaeota archaeon]|nr:hypothetical protein [Candidatus Woesearchaeota archaeon]
MNNHILGDKKKSNFDENLADVVNKIFDNMPERTESAPKIVSPGKKVILNYYSANGGGSLTQDFWLKYWNEKNDGEIMASMADFYQAFKQLKHKYETGTPGEKKDVEDFCKNLRYDMRSSMGNAGVLISSTTIIYTQINLQGRIIHHYNCKEKELIKEYYPWIPVCMMTPIESLCASGFIFLGILFNTKDDHETIIQTLEFISGLNRSKIVVETALSNKFVNFVNDATRENHPKRLAGFVLHDKTELSIVGHYMIEGNHGHSRGVRYE